jgi:hypothetical protein
MCIVQISLLKMRNLKSTIILLITLRVDNSSSSTNTASTQNRTCFFFHSGR